MALEPGDKAPDFKVNDQDGNPVSLSDFKGKVANREGSSAKFERMQFLKKEI